MNDKQIRQLEEEIRHLEELKEQHRKNLRALQKKAASYSPANVPLSLANEIESEQEEIERLTSQLEQLYNKVELEKRQDLGIDTYNRSYGQSSNETLTGSYSFSNLFLIALIIVVAVSCITSLETDIRINEQFNRDAGLGAWRTKGVISLVKDGRESVESNMGGMQIPALPDTYAYQLIPGSVRQGERYTAEVWCKAPVGIRCKVFLGSAQVGFSMPSIDDPNTFVRDGTGDWESMRLTVKVGEEKDFAIFLYAEGAQGHAIFDDLRVLRNK